jgi:hypothetical protein
MNDARLREAYETLLRERSGRDNELGVSLETMRDVLDRKGSDESRLAAIDRIMAHPRLAEEFEILRAAQAAGQYAQRRTYRAWPMAIAASVIAAVGLGTWLARRSDDANDQLRGASVAIPLYAPAETALADSARLFLWAGNPDATQYVFELNTAGGSVLFSATTTDTSVVLPDSVRLTPGASYIWWVRATMARGELTSSLRPLVTRER